MLIGRKSEIQSLEEALLKPKAQFIALYGRRRVGKTYLIQEFFKNKVDHFFFVSGLKNGSTKTQLRLFKTELQNQFYGGLEIPNIPNWLEAFKLLDKILSNILAKPEAKPIIIFLDEIPWLASKKSGLLEALDHFWNTKFSRLPQLKLIVCGSAASWILKHFILAKGGLYNRITQQILLKPLSFHETIQYLKEQKCYFKFNEYLELYLLLGGIPHYLNSIKPQLSVSQNIAQLCFDKDAPLAGEFEHIFYALFDHASNHYHIINYLFKNSGGKTKTEIGSEIGVSSGGRLTLWIQELLDSGFITGRIPYLNKTKDIRYYVNDEYSLFYLTWIGPWSKHPENERVQVWYSHYNSQAFKIYLGLAFEKLVMKNAAILSKKLGLEGISYQTCSWFYRADKNSKSEAGAQIDLLYDRNDNIITLCEVKYRQEPFEINKELALDLKRKIEVFEKKTKTKKRITLALVSPYGFKQNIWSEGLIDFNIIFSESLWDKI